MSFQLNNCQWSTSTVQGGNWTDTNNGSKVVIHTKERKKERKKNLLPSEWTKHKEEMSIRIVPEWNWKKGEGNQLKEHMNVSMASTSTPVQFTKVKPWVKQSSYKFIRYINIKVNNPLFTCLQYLQNFDMVLNLVAVCVHCNYW